MMVIFINDAVVWEDVNRAIKETGVQLSMFRTYLTYNMVCKLCKIATDGYHIFDDNVQDVLDAVVHAWELWNNPRVSKTYFSNERGYAVVIDD
jgi:hypothetical protein